MKSCRCLLMPPKYPVKSVDEYANDPGYQKEYTGDDHSKSIYKVGSGEGNSWTALPLRNSFEILQRGESLPLRQVHPSMEICVYIPKK